LEASVEYSKASMTRFHGLVHFAAGMMTTNSRAFHDFAAVAHAASPEPLEVGHLSIFS
jgi:hypothetical protein